MRVREREEKEKREGEEGEERETEGNREGGGRGVREREREREIEQESRGAREYMLGRVAGEVSIAKGSTVFLQDNFRCLPMLGAQRT